VDVNEKVIHQIYGKKSIMEDIFNISVLGIVQLFMLIGLFGSLIPMFPGLVIMWGAALGYGIAQGFSTAGIIIFIIVTILVIIGSLVDNLLMGAGARKGGASWSTIFVALLAGVLGTLLFPPIGGIIAIPLAVMLLEFIRLGNIQKAWFALRGLVTGWGLSYIVRFLLGFIILVLWWGWLRLG
jgi:uncharacterized protein